MTERRAGAARCLPVGTLALRFLALALVLAWVAWSVARGGLRQAVAAAWSGATTRGLGVPGHLDARRQWTGPYYDALDFLTRQPLDANTTIAVVLFPSTRVDFASGVNPRRYEAMYRLYPVRPDIYIASTEGEPEVSWFGSPKSQVPTVPALWKHTYVIWSDSGRAPAASGYRLLFANDDARVYRARDHQ